VVTSQGSVPPTHELGTLKRLEARIAWIDEARDFTPWLADHLDLLGDALGLDLQLENQEVGVGPFSADVIATTANGELVVIENQLERTDHSHLGQILTYAAGKDATTVVWIAPEFRDEHRQALDWLNSSTPEGVNFFGVEIELLQIDSSPPAPHFKLVSQPNEWAKATKIQEGAAPTELGLRYQRFFTEVLRRFKAARPHLTSGSRVGTNNWYPFTAGRPGFQFVWSLSVGSRFRCELYIDAGSAEVNADYLNQLQQQTADIEAAVGEPVVWEALSGKRACRAAVYRKVNRETFDTDEDVIRWGADTMVRFADALRPRIKGLRTPALPEI
jgi:hypothetical protein